MRSFAYLFTCILIATSASAQSDPCVSLLSGGAFKYKLADNSTHTYNNAKDWFCSTDFSTYARDRKTSAGADIVIPGIDLPVGGNYDSSDASSEQKRQTFCKDSNKTFTKDQEQFLINREGDPVIVKGFIACEDNRNKAKAFLQTSVNSHSSGIFDIGVISQGYPGGHPLIVEVKPVTNADAVLAPDFTAGTEIPQTGSGNSPLVGTYAFANNAQQAAVLVRTTIGTSIVTAKRCLTGKAGTYTVRQDTPHTSTVRIADYTSDFSVPQAGCHPKCGAGDPISLVRTVPIDVVLKNPRVVCAPDGGRPECPLNPMSVSLVDDHTLGVGGRTRTVALPYRIYAEQYTQKTTTTRDEVFSADIQYFQPFSVSIPNSGGGDFVVKSAFGNITVDKQSLDSGGTVNWLSLQGSPQIGSKESTYTLIAKPPDCAD